MAVAQPIIDGPESPSSLPIVIAGGGCVGLFLALLLSTTSLIPNQIIIIEPNVPDPTSTRAMSHQPLTYSFLSRVPGLLPELIKAGNLSSGLCFRTSVANGSHVIASKVFTNEGEGMKGKGQLLLPQGKFQEILMRRLVATSNVEVRLGSSVKGFEIIDSNSVAVTVSFPSTSTSETINAAYLIGADGSHSVVRKSLGVEFTGETLDSQLVATDLYYDFHTHGFFDANFIIDPIHYGLIGLIEKPKTSGARALWRVSYGAPFGQSELEIKEAVDEKLRNMLPNLGLNGNGEKTYEVARIAPYKAQQRIASRLYSGRVCLVGDAAHLTNPYAGLGLASGIADASSLAEVLSHILSGHASDDQKLLNAWSEARRQRFFDVVDKPSRMAYQRVQKDLSTADKVSELLARDPMVKALKSGMPVMLPTLETKGEDLDGW